MYSPAKIDNIARKMPENLIFCNEKTLIEVVSDDFNEELVRANCLAELLLREYFSRDEKLRQVLTSVLSTEEVSAFLSAMPHNFFTPGDEERLRLKGNSSLSVSCFNVLRKRLAYIFLTDGIIPVEYDCKGWLIPFDLQIGAVTQGVFDLSGKFIPEWSNAVQLLNLPSQVKIRLHCYHQKETMGDFIGHSLMLPVWAAYLRKINQLPKYNPFRMIFTGAFDVNDRLSSVDTEGKIRAITQGHPKACFFLPEDESGNSEQRNLYYLPPVGKDELTIRLQQEIEKQNDTLFEYALNRLPSICEEVRSLQHANWDDLILRLENNAAFDEDDNLEEYLLNLTLQSEAHCHAGHTKTALELNLEAQKLAKKHGKCFEKMLMRLQVNKLVLLVDDAKFDEIKTIAPELEKMIDNSGDSDLQMRFHGTMGQIHAYGTLSNVDQCTKEKSLQHFQIAKEKAFELGRLEDKRQDLNYLHLWHAIFMPGTKEELAALKRAEKMSLPHDRESDISANRVRNICFLRRQQLFARYRRYLLTGISDEYELPQDIDTLLEGPNTWCRALAYKYQGALEIAWGNRDTAEKHFSRATESIQGEEYPIINFIKMTIYAEAYRSLGIKDYQTAGKKLALQLLDEYANPKIVIPWLEYFEQKNNAAPFTEFWY